MTKYRASKGFMPRPIPLLHVDGPLMVFGGPYSNLEATRAVLDEATRLSISADRIICTGDVVAYGADAPLRKFATRACQKSMRPPSKPASGPRPTCCL